MTTPPRDLVVGPEPLRRHITAQLRAALPDARVVDAETDPADALAAAAAGPGLFGPTGLVIKNAHTFTEKQAKELAAAVAAGDTAIVVEAEKLLAGPERALAGTFTITKLPAGRGKGLQRALQDTAAHLGLTLSAGAAATLEARTGGDPGRAVGTLEALAAGGYTTPTVAQVEMLAGDPEETGAPWTLLDALERGDQPRIAAELACAEAIPTIAFLAKRVTVATLLAEGHRPDELEPLAGNVTDAAVVAGKRMAGRAGRENLTRALSQLADADRHAKTGNPETALTLAAVAVTRALTRPAS